VNLKKEWLYVEMATLMRVLLILKQMSGITRMFHLEVHHVVLICPHTECDGDTTAVLVICSVWKVDR
jgi:hypothetical protein